MEINEGVSLKKELFQNKIVVKKSSLHGYGVYAKKRIRKGELIEECYMIVSRRGGDKRLEDYYFDVDGKYAIFTGFGIIYNHADDPNATYTLNSRSMIARFKATRTIQKGEEICVSYGDDWFSSRGKKAKKHRKKA